MLTTKEENFFILVSVSSEKNRGKNLKITTIINITAFKAFFQGNFVCLLPSFYQPSNAFFKIMKHIKFVKDRKQPLTMTCHAI